MLFFSYSNKKHSSICLLGIGIVILAVMGVVIMFWEHSRFATIDDIAIDAGARSYYTSQSVSTSSVHNVDSNKCSHINPDNTYTKSIYESQFEHSNRNYERQKRNYCLMQNITKKALSFSFIIVTRNNRYMGDSLGRTLRLFKQIVTFDWHFFRRKRDCTPHFIELIIVQWNNDINKTNLNQLKGFARYSKKKYKNKYVKIRWLTIDYAMHKQAIELLFMQLQKKQTNKHYKTSGTDYSYYQYEWNNQIVNFTKNEINHFMENCNFVEFFAKNIAARRSNNDFLIFLTSDSYFDPKLLTYLAKHGNSHNLLPYTLYLSQRPNIGERYFPPNRVYHTYSKFETGGTSNMYNDRRYLQSLMELHCHWKDWEIPWSYGEFQMLSKRSFDIIGGYMQAPQVFDIDSELFSRIKYVYRWDIVGINLDCTVFHQYHINFDVHKQENRDKILNTCNQLLPIQNDEDDTVGNIPFWKQYFEMYGWNMSLHDFFKHQNAQWITKHWGVPTLANIPEIVWN